MKTILIKQNESNYPKLLSEIYDPPTALYCRGDISILEDTCIAFVGTRRSSDYGEYLTNKLIGELAVYKVNIVSGLAHGIDTIAHQAALSNKLKTIAVIGSGIENIYPRSNCRLAKDISQNGLILSEYPGLTPPLKHHFPQRNRLISGLSIATVVIEAPQRSGALITAYLAFEQSREVFTVPGDIDRENSLGPLSLIKKNIAHPISSAQELIEILRLNSHLFSNRESSPKQRETKQTSSNSRLSLKLSPNETHLMEAISSKRFSSFSDLQSRLKLPVQATLIALSTLELYELIETRDGKYRRKC